MHLINLSIILIKQERIKKIEDAKVRSGIELSNIYSKETNIEKLLKDNELKVTNLSILNSANYQNALLEIKKGNWENALKSLNEEAIKNPDSAEVFYNRGIVKFRLENEKGSCEDWKKAEKFGSKQIKYIPQFKDCK